MAVADADAAAAVDASGAAGVSPSVGHGGAAAASRGVDFINPFRRATRGHASKPARALMAMGYTKNQAEALTD